MANSNDVQQVLKKFKHFQCKHFKRHLCATGWVPLNDGMQYIYQLSLSLYIIYVPDHCLLKNWDQTAIKK